MPHPREAIFDVLRSKARRKVEDEKLVEAWARYEEQNKQANAMTGKKK